MKLRTLLALGAAMLISAAASAYSVRIKVLDPDGEPESYATCRLFNLSDTVKAITGGLTDTLGVYRNTLPKPGDYMLKVEVVGRAPISRTFSVTGLEPDADLGTISPDATVLGEVVVTAQRPLVVKEIDRIGYDVQADDDAKTSTVNEILRKVPMVNVDSDGAITINGSSNFQIYKNGRPNSSMSKNAKDLFKALPASMIKKIEVITEPGAKFDAEGVAAILNIVTVENTVMRGVMGNASVSGNNLAPFNYGSLFLTSQIDKVTFSVNGGLQYMTRRLTERETTEEYIYENGNTRNSFATNHNKGFAGWGGLELSYEMDSLNLFTAEANFFSFGVKPKGFGQSEMFAPDGSIISSYKSDFHYPKYQYYDIDATFAYQRSTARKGETFSLSYMVSTNRQDNHEQQDYYDIVGDLFPYTSRDDRYKLNFIEHTFQADWTRPFAKIHTLDLGAKYILRRNTSKDNATYEGWEDRYTNFRHITDIAALYAQYSVRIKKLTFRAGLRYEFSKLKASYPEASIPAADDKPFSTTLNDWVPSAAASWSINDANSLTLNYATRINRPGISYLNPALNISPTQISGGNPDLESSRHQSIKLSYMLVKPKFNMQASVAYGFANNAIARYSTLVDNVVYNSYGNIGHSRNWNFSAYAQWSPGSKTRLMVNFMAGHDHTYFPGTDMKNWSWGGFFNVNQKLPYKFEAEFSAWVMPQWTFNAYTKVETKFIDRVSPSLSLKRNFLKDDRLSLRLSWSGIFKAHRTMAVHTVGGPYTGWQYSTTPNNQRVSLTVSYRFGSLNAQVKKTRNRISNDDLQGGNSAGGSQTGGQSK